MPETAKRASDRYLVSPRSPVSHSHEPKPDHKTPADVKTERSTLLLASWVSAEEKGENQQQLSVKKGALGRTP